jgi:hypothetical protein
MNYIYSIYTYIIYCYCYWKTSYQNCTWNLFIFPTPVRMPVATDHPPIAVVIWLGILRKVIWKWRVMFISRLTSSQKVAASTTLTRTNCNWSEAVSTHKQTPWPLVRKRTIPTERGNFVPTSVDTDMSRSQRGGIPTPVNHNLLDRNRYFFFQVALHLSSRGWVGPVSEPLLLRNLGSARNRIRDLWVSSQELWGDLYITLLFTEGLMHAVT